MRWLIALSLVLTAFAAQAQTSPVGFWYTIDDETGDVRSRVELNVVNGELVGHIREIIKSDRPRDQWFCDQCKGDKRDAPFEGLQIIEGLRWDAGKQEWNGGTITDPANGKEYKALLTVADNGDTLEVRGFIGFALIGRTQTWQAVQ
ncbi:DUF2147 domain-containing protein [Salinispirillum marinum]|uniref:DUF2147 domain-containing protein n=2 Tax=Saccharospirillaceae TaxID=255527 RepID=A0ABV8BC77_9GAMM